MRMKNAGKRKVRICAALIIAMCMTLSGCGLGNLPIIGKFVGGVKDANLGVYSASTATMLGFSVDISEVYEDGFDIVLEDKGKCTLEIDGDSGKGKWKLDGNDITITGKGLELNGTLLNGVMVLEDVMGTGMEITLINNSYEGMTDGDGYDNPLGGLTDALTGLAGDNGPETGTATIEKTEIQKYWNGDWYGYMYIADGTGNYEAYKGISWDTCAIFDIDEKGDGNVTIWYGTGDGAANGTSYDSPIAYGNINVSSGTGFGEHGMGMSINAWAFADNECGQAGEDWVLYPGADSDFADMMSFGSEFTDEGGTMEYMIVLRPWGNTWEEASPDDLEYLMHGFKTWYMPKIEAGMAMPLDFVSEPVKTMEERRAELLGTDATSTAAGSSSDESGTTSNAASQESYDNVTPSGEKYTWGNITAVIPDGMTATNGGIADPDDENSLWIQDGMKYFLISVSDIEKAQMDVESTKSFNDGTDASFAVNGILWTAAKYEYSGTPVWQAYATIGGTVYEVMCYGYEFGNERTLTVLSSLE